MTNLLRTVCLFVVTFLSAGVFAQPPTLEGAAKATFDDASHASGSLAKLGAKPGRVLVAERLPDGSFLVEQSFELNGKTGRIAMRLERTDKGWVPMWQADAAFGTALGNVLKSGALPSADASADRRWSDIPRMPAFPVVVTAKRVITPFGAIERTESEAADGQSNRAGPTRGTSPGRPKPTGPLPTSRELARHTGMWVTRALGDDPAPAGFDLIIDESISWERFNAALFSVAGVGLYIGEIVANGQHDWVGIPFAAPVSTATQGSPPELVLAYYPVEAGFGFRIVHNRELVAPGETCEAPMAICGASVAEFPAALSGVIEGDIERAMFASGPTTSASSAIAYIVAAQAALELRPHRLFIGFISL